MDISGLIIDTQEGDAERVAAAVTALDGVELLHLVEPSRVAVLVEAEGIDPSMDLSSRIWEIPGVVAINLACHYHDVDGDRHLRDDRRDDRRDDLAAALAD